ASPAKRLFPSISAEMRPLPACITRGWDGCMCRDKAPLEVGKRCSKLSMIRRRLGFGSRWAAQGQHAAPDALIRHILMYRRAYADPRQSSTCPINITQGLARFGGGHLDDS